VSAQQDIGRSPHGTGKVALLYKVKLKLSNQLEPGFQDKIKKMALCSSVYTCLGTSIMCDMAA